ncbi:RNA-binding protein 4B-like [Gastrophryne carolinensis]
MVKLFVGSLPPEATPVELRSLFEQFGKVTECTIIANYAFVHMDEKAAAEEAVHNLNRYKLHGHNITVEHSKSKAKASTKLYVGGLLPGCTNDELREKFEEYGSVLECDVIRDYAFVHMEKAEEALEAIKNLNGYDFKGKRMYVQLSTSRQRINPGMGERTPCYHCGKAGHKPEVCYFAPVAQESAGPPYDPYVDACVPARSAAAPPPPVYSDRMLYDERRRLIDYYHRYRIRSSPYDTLLERRLPPLPSATVSSVTQRKRVESYPYERQLLPPPAPLPSYYTRERSPLSRTTVSTIVEDYALERRLHSVIRNALYESPRYSLEESYADHLQYY